MKKIFIVALALTAVSCKKQIPPRAIVEITNRTIPYRQIPESPDVFLSFQEDLNYERIDVARYQLSTAIKENITVSISNYIREHCNNNSLSISIDSIFSAFPEFLASVEYSLGHQPQILNYQFENTNQVKQCMIRNGINYDLYFTLIEPMEVENNVLPIVCTGADIGNDYDSTEQDQVAAWVINDSPEGRNSSLIALNEGEALSQSSPIISITLNKKRIKMNSGNSPSRGTGTPPWTYSDFIELNALRITKRAEKRGPSEVFYGMKYDYGTYWDWKEYNGGYAKTEYILKRMPRNDIGNWKYGIDAEFTHFARTAFTSKTLYATLWNSYERDWWESRKVIATAYNDGEIWGNMTFEDDTFMYHPSEADENAPWFFRESLSDLIWITPPNQLIMTGDNFQARITKK